MTETAPIPEHLAISNDQINKLPLYRHEGPIHLVDRDEALAAILPGLQKEALLGFDTETRPSFKKGESYAPALVQLATADAVYVIQLSALSDLSWFKKLFAPDRIVKAGVSTDYDVRKLREMHAFEPGGFVDLANLAARAGIRNRGLRGLAALLMGIRISKGARRSNWARRQLSQSQILYAATDAWLCRELYLRLSRLPARPASPEHAGDACVSSSNNKE